MFGYEVLVAPILFDGLRNRPVYLPKGVNWRESSTGQVYAGGSWINAAAALDVLPLFTKENSDLKISI